jgi:hypothetical protein
MRSIWWSASEGQVMAVRNDTETHPDWPSPVAADRPPLTYDPSVPTGKATSTICRPPFRFSHPQARRTARSEPAGLIDSGTRPKLLGHAAASAVSAKRKGAPAGSHQPRKARPSVWPIQSAETAASGWSAALLLSRSEASSKRSRFITLVQAATKSSTNFSCASAEP